MLDQDVTAAEGSCREAIVVAEEAGATWFAALARSALRDTLLAKGDRAAADGVRTALEAWRASYQGSGPQFFFVALGGDPRSTIGADQSSVSEPTCPVKRTRGRTWKKPRADSDLGLPLVGDTGFEPVTSSVSRKRATAAPIARGRVLRRGGYGI